MSGGAFSSGLKTIAVAAAMVVLGLAGSAIAGDVPVPVPAKGAGEACVADTDYMRRYHMTMLKHQRDDTVHDGIRTERFSLKGCIDCHAVEGDESKPVKITDSRHFCRSCHDYAAVRVDCFECHSSVPESKDAASAPRPGDVAALGAYLKGRKQ